MNCSKCGAPLTAQDQFCKGCGTPNNAGMPAQPAAPVAPAQPAAPAQPMAPAQPAVMPGPAVMPQVGGAAVAPATPAKSGGKGGLYAIICVAILAVAAVVIFVVALNAGLIGGEAPTEPNEPGEDVAEVSTYKVTMGSWTFDIPTNLAVEEYDGTLLLADLNDKSWAIRFAPLEGNLKYLNKAGLISAYQAQGITVKNVQKTIDGYNFESFELSAGGDTAIMAYADLNANYVMAVQAIKTTGELAYDKISVVTKIMKTASYSVTTNMESGAINGFGTAPSFTQQ